MELVAHTRRSASAWVAWVQAEVERTIADRVSYKVLGVAAILRRAVPVVQGNQAVSTLALTEAQTRLLIRMAPNLLSSFRRDASAP